MIEDYKNKTQDMDVVAVAEYEKVNLDGLPNEMRLVLLKHLIKHGGAKYIPDHYWTSDLAKIAIKVNIDILADLPQSIKTKKFYKKIIWGCSSWSRLKKLYSEIPESYLDKELILNTCETITGFRYEQGYTKRIPTIFKSLLPLIPDSFKTSDFYAELCYTVPGSVFYVPENILNIQMIITSLYRWDNLLPALYDKHPNLVKNIEEEEWIQLIAKNFEIISHIPQDLITVDMAREALRDPEMAKYIPANCWPPDIKLAHDNE